MIDLHTHTDESDGSFAPHDLVESAASAGIGTLAITDHDTFGAYEKALPVALKLSVRLIRGIELNTRHAGRSVHLLAYFVTRDPAPSFLAWLDNIVSSRRDRNRRLIEKLQEFGLDIRLEEVEALGRTLTGRPHFARVLVAKGYAVDREEAFSKYIGETGRAFVERDSPTLDETIALVAEAGGISSLAHPIRLGRRDLVEEEALIASFRDIGLPAIEAFHTDHTLADIKRYCEIASKYGFGITGGSDFHGTYKSGVRLGHAVQGTLPIPDSVINALS